MGSESDPPFVRSRRGKDSCLCCFRLDELSGPLEQVYLPAPGNKVFFFVDPIRQDHAKLMRKAGLTEPKVETGTAQNLNYQRVGKRDLEFCDEVFLLSTKISFPPFSTPPRQKGPSDIGDVKLRELSKALDMTSQVPKGLWRVRSGGWHQGRDTHSPTGEGSQGELARTQTSILPTMREKV